MNKGVIDMKKFCGFLGIWLLLSKSVPASAAWTSMVDATTLTGITTDVGALNAFIISIVFLCLGVAIIVGVASRAGR